MSNILWLLNEISNEPYNHFIKIDRFNIDMIGGLKPILDLILKILIFYLLCVTLAIISYVSPFSLFSYESFFLVILLLIGVAFFVIGLIMIRKLLKGRIEEEINKINERYQLEHQRLLEFDSKGNYKDKTEELQLVSTTLETLYNVRERIIQLYSNSKGYDVITIAKFISSFIPPLIAYVQKFINLGLEIKKFLP